MQVHVIKFLLPSVRIIRSLHTKVMVIIRTQYTGYFNYDTYKKNVIIRSSCTIQPYKCILLYSN